MSNAVSRAARERMARTGEPYTLARRMVIEERERRGAQQPEAEVEVTPENAPRLLAEGKITVNRAREAHGLPPFDPPPVPLVVPKGAGDYLRALLGPLDPEPSPGPPYTHVHRLPETEEEMASGPWPPITHTITRRSE